MLNPLATQIAALSTRYDELLRAEEYEQWLTGALELAALLRTAPDEYAGQLVSVLIRLAEVYGDGLRMTAAAEVAAEAVDRVRPLVELDPATHRPALVAALEQLGMALFVAARPAEAAQVKARLVDELGRLTPAELPEYGRRRAEALTQLGESRVRSGQPRQGIAAYLDGVEQYAILADADPGYTGLFGNSVGDMSQAFVTAGDFPDATAAGVAIATLLRRLLPRHPDLVGQLAAVLNTTAVRLAGHGAFEEASAAATEAVNLLRGLVADLAAADNQATTYEAVNDLLRYRSELGTALATLGAVHGQLGNTAERAAAVMWDAMAMGAARWHLGYADALNNLAIVRMEAGRQKEARGDSAEAVANYRGLANEWPAEPGPALARGLWTYAEVRLAGGAELPEALTAIQESVALYQRLADEHPDQPTADLSAATTLLAGVQAALAETAHVEPGAVALAEVTELLEVTPPRRN